MDRGEHRVPGHGLERSRHGSFAKPALNVALALTLFVAVDLTLLRLARIYLEFSSPIEITFAESVNVKIARDFRDGIPIYRDWQHQVPYIFAPYGPLLYAVPAWVSWLVGGREIDLFQRIGRAVSLAASAASLVLIAWMLRRRGVAWPFIVLADLLFASAEIAWPVQMMFRPDAMEVCWILAGLATASALWDTRWRALALVPLLIACLFKQSAIIAPVTLTLYVLSSEGARSALRFAVAVLGLYSFAAWLLVHLTGGLYYVNAVETLRGTMTWSNPATIAKAVIAGDPAIVGLGVAAIIGRWGRKVAARPAATRTRTPPRLDLLVVYLIIGTVFGLLGTLRDGSGTNYLFAVLAVATIAGTEELAGWTALAAATPQDRHRVDVPAAGSARTSAPRPIVAIGALLLVFVALCARLGRELPRAPSLLGELELRREHHLTQLSGLESLVTTLDALDGPILSNDNDINLRVRRPIMFELLTFGGLAEQGRFDDTAVLEMIRTHLLGAIVLDFRVAEVLPEYQSTAWVRKEWIRAIRDGRYSHTAVFTGHRWYYVYEPPRSSRVMITADTAALEHPADLIVDLLIQPYAPGVSTFTVAMQSEAGAELGEIRDVELRAFFDGPNAPPMARHEGVDQKLTETAVPGIWSADAALLTRPGDWRIEIRIRRRGADDVVTQQVSVRGVGGILALENER